MIDSRVIIVQYCDDVRQEVGNKYSLMGCYGTDLLLNKLPGVLPKLCARVQVLTPLDRPLSELTIRAELNDETISEVQLDAEQLAQSQKNLDRNDDGRGTMVVAIMTFAPFPVDEPCKLRIVAETEEGLLRGNVLHVKAAG